MFNLYSVEAEVEYRKEQFVKSLPRVEEQQKLMVWFKIKQLFRRLTSKKPLLETGSKSNYECTC
ncbi:hypothetical protein [Alkalihalobacillus sp. AL-G]|uniref:hypothetical protein n=1 Tax=Alkalihalobacillus sp. AL-G TaxID=2926399 RepID=UPI00272C8471|nr:hypothetical protein [Alkalihalobacillus sp. AL-G]WLD92771.1 hypothetical protein MOJ78_17435 [Alkalihalobacillus sp. AL-G]